MSGIKKGDYVQADYMFPSLQTVEDEDSGNGKAHIGICSKPEINGYFSMYVPDTKGTPVEMQFPVHTVYAYAWSGWFPYEDLEEWMLVNCDWFCALQNNFDMDY